MNLFFTKVFCIYNNSTLPLSRYCCHKAIPTNEKQGNREKKERGKERNTSEDYIFTGEDIYPSSKIISMINSSTVPYLANRDQRSWS